MPTKPKRPVDVVSNGVLAMRVLTGEAYDTAPVVKVKNKAAQELGSKGGTARAQSMTADRRKVVATKAAETRWSRKKSD